MHTNEIIMTIVDKESENQMDKQDLLNLNDDDDVVSEILDCTKNEKMPVQSSINCLETQIEVPLVEKNEAIEKTDATSAIEKTDATEEKTIVVKSEHCEEQNNMETAVEIVGDIVHSQEFSPYLPMKQMDKEEFLRNFHDPSLDSIRNSFGKLLHEIVKFPTAKRKLESTLSEYAESETSIKRRLTEAERKANKEIEELQKQLKATRDAYADVLIENRSLKEQVKTHCNGLIADISASLKDISGKLDEWKVTTDKNLTM